jgi:hypothetical protein
VREIFRRYAEENCSIADLARWLTEQGIPTRKGSGCGIARRYGG